MLAQEAAIAFDSVLDTAAAQGPPEDSLAALDDVDVQLVFEGLNDRPGRPVRRAELDGVDLGVLVFQLAGESQGHIRWDAPNLDERVAGVLGSHLADAISVDPRRW